ncbi:MAG: hypothetical protein ACFFD2_10480 [Promethearchaeota archaeon]
MIATTFNSQPSLPHLAYELARWIVRNLPEFLKAHLRALSRRLTRQVKRTLNASKRTLPKTKAGTLIRRRLKGHNLSLKTLDVKSWERVQKNWRDSTFKYLKGKFKEINIATFAIHTVQERQSGLA